MKHKFVIIEDEKGALDLLMQMMEKHTDFDFSGFATNVNDALALILDKKPDLIFLDVELGSENGFSIHDELKNILVDIPFVIMTTGNDIYAKDAINNQISYFISKPILEINLLKSLQVFKKNYVDNKDHIFLRNNGYLQKVMFNDIIFLSSDEGYTNFYLSDNKKISLPNSLKYFESLLSSKFVRIHRGYIVNVDKIEKVKVAERQLVLSDHYANKHHIEIGKTFLPIIRKFVS